MGHLVTSQAFLRVERDMRVSGLRYEFSEQSADLPPNSAEFDKSGQPVLWLTIRGAGTVGIGFLDHEADEDADVYWVADQVQDAVLDSGQVVKPARTWPRAERGGCPLWARLRDGTAVGGR